MPHQCSRVDVGKHRHLELLQIFFGHLLRAPVRTDTRELTHDQAFDPRTRGLVVGVIGSVISDFRVGQYNDLPRVGWVGENFLVASNGSIKNDFAVAFAFGAVAFASEDSAVFEGKDSLHSRSREWILRILSGNSAAAKGGTQHSKKKSVDVLENSATVRMAPPPPGCNRSAAFPSARAYLVSRSLYW